MNIRPFAAVVLLFAAACSRRPQPVAVAPRPADTAAVQTAAAPAPIDTTPAVDPARARADSVRAQVLRDDSIRAAGTGPLTAEDSLLSAVVHFGYDSFELSPEARAVLEQKAQLLRRNGRLRIEIAGHADDRGPDEYNLALGLRRAAAARAFLAAYGIDQERLSVVSFGEERPLVAESNESAWAQNRRASFSRRP